MLGFPVIVRNALYIIATHTGLKLNSALGFSSTLPVHVLLRSNCITSLSAEHEIVTQAKLAVPIPLY